MTMVTNSGTQVRWKHKELHMSRHAPVPKNPASKISSGETISARPGQLEQQGLLLAHPTSSSDWLYKDETQLEPNISWTNLVRKCESLVSAIQ